MDEDQITALDTPKKTSGSSNTRKKTASKKKNINGEMTPKELQTSWHYLFKIVSMIRRSKTQFAEDEFKELANAYHNLANRHAVLKYAFVIMAPLATVGELIDKFRKVEQGVEKKPKPPKNQATNAAANPNVVDVNDMGGGIYGTAGGGAGTS